MCLSLGVSFCGWSGTHHEDRRFKGPPGWSKKLVFLILEVCYLLSDRLAGVLMDAGSESFLPSPIPSLIHVSHSLISLLTHSRLSFIAYSFIFHSVSYPFSHPLTHDSRTDSRIYQLILTHSLNKALSQSLIQSVTHLYLLPLTHAFVTTTHSSVYSLTHFPLLSFTHDHLTPVSLL